MTSSPHGPYIQGYRRATMGGTKGMMAGRRLHRPPCDPRQAPESHLLAEKQQRTRDALVAGLDPTSRDTSGRQP